MSKKRYWEVYAVVQESNRPNDVNPVATFKVITLDGERPSDPDMIRAATMFGVKRGRLLIFQQTEIGAFDPPVEVCYEGSTSKSWIIKPPVNGESQ